ncbi:TOMM precursor leader peptide-binding protein [Sorangium sp. So ce385]|uniref:TOMM precursor leader peptide-binding protein n=1 Tax=Sorangium sp. So ce385 TaxID=3133308 RepID=UPI003F5C1BF4
MVGFKLHLRVEPLDEERVFLVGEQERFMLRGRVYALLAPLLDGTRAEREIVTALAGQVSPAEVYWALSTLEQRGYLAEAVAALAPEATAFWQSLGADARLAAERLKRTAVAIRSPHGVDPRPLVEALERAGLLVDERAGLWVVLTEDYLAAELAAWNLEALSGGYAWFPVKPTGRSPWWGPVLQPGGACWECMAHWLRVNRPVEGYLSLRRGVAAAPAAPRAGIEPSIRAGIELSALALSRWIVEKGGSIVDHLFTLDAGSLQVSEHAVTRRPQCRACGDPEMLQRRARAPLEFERRPSHADGDDDGGYRALSPEETYSRHRHLISPLTGVVGSLGPLPGCEGPPRTVYQASFRVRPLHDAPSLDDFHRTSSGKGRTPAQARASALCEAIERHCAIFQGDEPRVRARLDELGDGAVHPQLLQGISDSQYRAREVTNARTRDARLLVPPRFDERTPIEWSPVWSLTEKRHRYVPTEYCYLNAPVRRDEQCCPFNSNGNAAGNCLEEAILQGYLELVERDAVAVWWYNRVQRPRVDLASFEDPFFFALEEHYRKLGWSVRVLDLTHDLEIPSFVALAEGPDGAHFYPGFGCHLDARVGISRALTELNQIFDPSLRASPLWDSSAVRDPFYLYPSPAMAPRARADYPAFEAGDILTAVEECVARAERVGLETMVLDQTRPDIGLCVVKVVVPGLRHYWPRFGPGRLYQVPVREGWLERPRAEEELNPVHLLG